MAAGRGVSWSAPRPEDRHREGDGEEEGEPVQGGEVAADEGAGVSELHEGTGSGQLQSAQTFRRLFTHWIARSGLPATA